MAHLTLQSGSQLQIHDHLYNFIKELALKNTDWSADEVFITLGKLVEEFGPVNQQLLDKRSTLQNQIDKYYTDKRAAGWLPSVESSTTDASEFEDFLIGIGYIQPDIPINFQMNTPQLDSEMDQNGPELVTPVSNASMAVGGANARWGSLYDAYFLSDVRPDIDKNANRPERLQMVVEDTNAFLDKHVASWDHEASFNDISRYEVNKNNTGAYELSGTTKLGTQVNLTDTEKFIGFNRYEDSSLSSFFLKDNGLIIECQLYQGGYVNSENGQFKDLIVESAVTNIIDFEDSVSITNAEELVGSLENYLGLISGHLQAYGSRGNLKTMSDDKVMFDNYGNKLTLKGTSLMSVRNVSIHMYTDIVTLNNQPIPERMLGVLLTSLIATNHDNGSQGEEIDPAFGTGSMPHRQPNSSLGYVYQVTPKLHSPQEVTEQVRFFERIEEYLNLKTGTILIGIMNEELGMTLQLSEALRAAQNRAFFINTGFLDRTGSQIRVQMHAGPVNMRDDLTQEKYNSSYEAHNVDVGIQTGIHKHGKIGKGMQVRNRAMAEMLTRKIDHPRTGGNTAWVPAPYPSDLHSMHYHMIDVDNVQSIMEDSPALNISRQDLLTFPLYKDAQSMESSTRQTLVSRYIHSMIAYAEPWVNRGIGCSGVLNFEQVEEMKDRATERIDGAILANWKLHGLISNSDIERAIREVCLEMDQTNSQLEGYLPMADTSQKLASLLSNPTISSVLGVIDDALSSPSAYVESALFKNRLAILNSERMV